MPTRAQGSPFSYTVGFLLSLGLTVAPYLTVTEQWLSGIALMLALAGFAVAQLVVQLVFFLHLGRGSNARWSVIALLFALLVIVIIVVGSLWIMTNLNYNMMITPEQMDERMKYESLKGF